MKFNQVSASWISLRHQKRALAKGEQNTNKEKKQIPKMRDEQNE